ncbi:MFS transporter [Achromobacter insuavis]|uniref:Major facilitator superfamily transporter n=1 Tax=Achromobacter insuavis AXX-A TaxID=1003200 RepID=F7T6I3_9BURK|nr:MFS transporter [Achromobacter insuavis]EGP44035.1 major facilitator superfamily transporter [Achromobacter insuavis AXX-A]
MRPALRHGLAQALFGWLNLALTAPGVYLWLGLPLVLRQHGWSGTAIGLFQLASLPTVFKFLLAMPLDRHGAGRGGYRRWTVALLLAYAAVLLALGWRDLLNDGATLFALAAAAALAGTWADVPVNALAIRVLPPASRAWAGGIRSMALCLGAIAGGGLMLLAQARWGWQAPFLIMAAALALGAALTLLLQEATGTVDAERADDGAIATRQAIAYLRLPASRRWLPLLALLFPFIGAGWFYLKPLLLDHGLAPERVAWLVGVVGGAVGAVGSIVGARLLKHLGPGLAVPLHAGLGAAALAALALAVGLDAASTVLVACAMAVAASMGATAALVFGLMMSHARPGLQALDYGIQSSVFALTRIAAPLAAGVLLDIAGAGAMLAALAIGATGVLALAWRQGRALRG